MHLDLREIHQVGSATRERVIGPGTCPELSAHGIRLCGLSAARRGFRFQRPTPDMVQVLAVVAGTGEALVAGEWQPVAPGQAYVTPAEQAHAYRARGAWTLAWAILAPGSGWPARPLLRAGPVGPLQRAIEALAESVHARLSGVAAAQAAVVARLLDCWRQAGGGEHDARLQRLWQAVRARPAAEWSLALLAEQAALSREHLRRLCRRHHGRSPMAEVTAIRLDHAADLLLRHGCRVAEAAERCGYRNVAAFSTAFRRHYGRAPSRLRA